MPSWTPGGQRSLCRWESEGTDLSGDALGCVRTAGVSASDKQEGGSWYSVAVVSVVWGTL